jgi:DNA polymerase-3 subunit delta
MQPAQFLARVKKGELPAVCLFLGAEAYYRQRCRVALIEAHLGDQREGAITQYDAGETPLVEIIDDARALSLFASSRVILVIAAEAALPRVGRAAAEDGDDDAPAASASDDVLSSYVKDPSPGVLLVFEASRFDLDGEDKKKSERVRKFYAAIPEVVEFKRMSADEARVELMGMAKRLNVRIDAAAAGMLVESLAADTTRIATELEKLSLFAGSERAITVDDIVELVPDARETTIFNLVNAMGRGDRARSLAQLDILCREGEYLPLALAFLSTQFRQALVAQKAGLRTPQQVQSYFSKAGVAIWGSGAERVAQTAQKFSREQLESGMKLIFEADRDLRSARPDDRIVMEQFVIRLTG